MDHMRTADGPQSCSCLVHLMRHPTDWGNVCPGHCLISVALLTHSVDPGCALFREIHGSFACAKKTAEVMRLLITTQRHTDAVSLVEDVRTVGTKLQAAKPVGKQRLQQAASSTGPGSTPAGRHTSAAQATGTKPVVADLLMLTSVADQEHHCDSHLVASDPTASQGHFMTQ